MSRNAEKDALKMADTNQKILQAAFRCFTDKTIAKVSMNDIATAADIGVATLYRYYKTKTALVLAVGTWLWEQQIRTLGRSLEDIGRATGAESLDYFLDTFLRMYRGQKDILRFNQFFNVYIQNEEMSPEGMRPYMNVINLMADRFHIIYQKGEQDGTLRTEIPEAEMFSTAMHLMLAAATRYAVGLVYQGEYDPEKELLRQKRMLLREFATPEAK